MERTAMDYSTTHGMPSAKSRSKAATAVAQDRKARGIKPAFLAQAGA